MGDKKKILIIWNDDEYAKAIQEGFAWVTVVTNNDELMVERKQNKISNYTGIVILAELKWSDNYYSDFYGFQVVSRLRAEYRLKCPIAICSFMPQPWLRKKFPILNFPQHHPFIHLPVSPGAFIEIIEKAEAADEPRLNDIIINYCDPKGRLIKLITHGKGFRQITRNAGVINGYDSLWSDCHDDLALLRSYLANKALGKTALTIGFEVEAKIQEAITERNLVNLFVTKLIIDRFLNELVNMKGIPIVH